MKQKPKEKTGNSKGKQDAETTISEVLVRQNYITQEDADKADEYTKKNGTSIESYLISQGLLTADLFGQAMAEAMGLIYADLNSHQPTKEQVLKIPEEIAKEFRVVLFDQGEKNVTIATDIPLTEGLDGELKKLFPKRKITIAFSLTADIDTALINYQKTLETRFSKIIENAEHVAPEIIEEIFDDALLFHASDIHLEPQVNFVSVRFRVDGILREAGKIPKEHYENIINRIKVRGHLRIDEHLSAQDGSMRYIKNERSADLRISIVPTLDGEKVVIRVLAEYVRGFALGDLGLSPADQQLLEESAKKPFGMIMVTGPTGSGKTTTLYALLKILHKPEANLTTIEDPVEYKIPGVNQIQVREQTGLTFSKGLRSIVRQDPDIILVGEIRDEETAEIAVNAALTGHLLLSTFHANDAATSIPRLLDMNIEPFLLASTLELIVAQRLVRKICDNCRVSEKIDTKVLTKDYPTVKSFFKEKTVTLYKGKGCNVCNHTGYTGRIAIYELISVTQEMENLILQNPSSQEVQKLSLEQGSRPLFEDGVDKVRSGVTTLEELLRVALPPSTFSHGKTKK